MQSLLLIRMYCASHISVFAVELWDVIVIYHFYVSNRINSWQGQWGGSFFPFSSTFELRSAGHHHQKGSLLNQLINRPLTSQSTPQSVTWKYRKSTMTHSIAGSKHDVEPRTTRPRNHSNVNPLLDADFSNGDRRPFLFASQPRRPLQDIIGEALRVLDDSESSDEEINGISSPPSSQRPHRREDSQ